MNNTGVEDGRRRRTVAADGIAAGTRRLRSKRGRQEPISSFLLLSFERQILIVIKLNYKGILDINLTTVLYSFSYWDVV
jgi:hypothetical protein